MSPEQKYAEKKREAAVKLLEQKEKAIQKALATKMQQYSGQQADELLARALELEIEAEVERRFEEEKRKLVEDSSRNLKSARSLLS